MKILSGYAGPVFNACLLFLPVAVLITLPFMAWQYRRYGGIPILKAIVIYGFVLYMMCAFLLTVLPLPDFEKVAGMTGPATQLIPFSTYADALRGAGFRKADLSTLFSVIVWKRFFTSSALFEILANIVMQIPLGVFLRYYFRRSWKQTLLIGFLVSLFYELTQLSGLYFIYPRPYRLCSVDDLIDNTLGAMIGYWITPFLCAILPTRDELDKLSIAKERRVTLTRRFTAAVIDWIPYCVLTSVLLTVGSSDSRSFLLDNTILYLLWVFTVMVLGQLVFHGKTFGKWLLRIQLIDSGTQGFPSFRSLIIRYSVLYLLLPAICMIVLFALLLMALAIFTDSAGFRLAGIAGMIIIPGTAAFILYRILRLHHEMPHSYWSRTRIVIVPKKTGK